MGYTPFPGPGSLALVQTTGDAGFPLQNATPGILSWTAPNDGLMHRVMVITFQNVTSAETGGVVSMTNTDPQGTPHVSGLYAGGSGVGVQYASQLRLVAPGTTVTVNQTSALTLGAATVWAEIWAS